MSQQVNEVEKYYLITKNTVIWIGTHLQFTLIVLAALFIWRPTRPLVRFIFKSLFNFIAYTIKYIFNEVKELVIRFYYFLKYKNTKLELITKEELMARVDKINSMDTFSKGHAFEDFVRDVFRNHGYTAFTTTDLRAMGQLPKGVQGAGGSGEQGVDVILDFKKNNVQKRLIIQVKCYSSTTPNSAVQEIYTAMPLYEGNIAMVVSNQDFSKYAYTLADSNGVGLVSREDLYDFYYDPMSFVNKAREVKIIKAA